MGIVSAPSTAAAHQATTQQAPTTTTLTTTTIPRISLSSKKHKPARPTYEKTCPYCGVNFKTQNKLKKYCKTNHYYRYNLQSQKQYHKKRKEEEKAASSLKKSITVKCPCCGDIHQKQVYYTGSLKVPLFLCEVCKRIDVDDDCIYNYADIINSINDSDETYNEFSYNEVSN